MTSGRASAEPEVLDTISDQPASAPVSRSHVRFEGAVVSVVSDTVHVNGQQVVRDVVAHPGAVAVVALRHDGGQLQVLMVRQYRHPLRAVTVELPAGLKDRLGESAEDCARRELLEETGYACGRLQPLLRCAPTPGGSDEVIDIFWTEDTRWQGLERTAEAEEMSMTAVWVPVAAALEAIESGQVINQTTQAGIYAIARKIGASD